LIAKTNYWEGKTKIAVSRLREKACAVLERICAGFGKFRILGIKIEIRITFRWKPIVTKLLVSIYE